MLVLRLERSSKMSQHYRRLFGVDSCTDQSLQERLLGRTVGSLRRQVSPLSSRVRNLLAGHQAAQCQRHVLVGYSLLLTVNSEFSDLFWADFALSGMPRVLQATKTCVSEITKLFKIKRTTFQRAALPKLRSASIFSLQPQVQGLSYRAWAWKRRVPLLFAPSRPNLTTAARYT